MTTTWTSADLDTIGNATELSITTRRWDGTLRPTVPIWVVRVGDDLYVRSYRGPVGAWYRHAHTQASAHIRVGDIERDVSVTAPGPSLRGQIDEAYRHKYSAHGRTYVAPMVADPAAATTLRLTPTD